MTLAVFCTPAFAEPDGESPLQIERENRHAGFTGSWLWAEGGDRLRLSLTLKNGRLTGFHTAIRQTGDKVDSVGGDSPLPSLHSDMLGEGTAVVRFTSGLPGSVAYGHARLTLRGDYLYWQVMDRTGESYFPDNAVLVRQSKR